MSLLNRVRGGRMSRTRIGAATVVHPAAGVTDETRRLAESLPTDPEHELVVGDLAADAPVELWRSLAAALPKGRRPVRVVPGGWTGEVGWPAWQWLADRTGRQVLAPCGTVLHLPGSLFAHPGAGWVSFGRGVAPVPAGPRFPQPAWDSVAVGQGRPAGRGAVAEPLPAGVWLRPGTGTESHGAARARLRTLPCLPDGPLVVLGSRDAAGPPAGVIDIADIAAYWRTLPADLAATARFVRYGATAPADGTAFGRELASVLGEPVCLYTGVPVGAPGAVEVVALCPDGSLGVPVFAQAFTHRPGGGSALLARRAPMPGLDEAAPGIYWYAPGVVLEVVRAGLWLRPAHQCGDPSGVRAVRTDPARTLLVHEAGLRELATTVLNRLAEPTARTTELVPATELPAEARPAVVRSQLARGAARPVPDDAEQTDLPWLSRLLDTMVLPAVSPDLSEVDGAPVLSREWTVDPVAVR